MRLTTQLYFIILSTGETYFAMYSAGEAVTISCVDSSGVADLVQWIDPMGTVLISSLSTAVTLTISSITDQHHGLDYVCRMRSNGVTHDLNYTIIVLGELNHYTHLLQTTVFVPAFYSTTSSTLDSN